MPEPSSDKGTIAIAFVHEALQCLRERAVPVEPLLWQAGIAPELLAAPQARVSSQHYGRLWHGIAETLDDEFFGLDSRRMKAGSFTLLCHALLHAGTLERALRRAVRFLRLVLDDLVGELEVDGAVVRLVVRDVPGADGRVPAPKRAFAYGTFLVVLHGLACWLVGRRLRALPPPAWPDFATLARQCHLSEATLRRRLDDEGASYRVILDDLRRDLAIGLLGDARLSIADVAAALGFAETSAFHRAFRKWTGARPGEYRPAGRLPAEHMPDRHSC